MTVSFDIILCKHSWAVSEKKIKLKSKFEWMGSVCERNENTEKEKRERLNSIVANTKFGKRTNNKREREGEKEGGRYKKVRNKAKNNSFQVQIQQKSFG